MKQRIHLVGTDFCWGIILKWLVDHARGCKSHYGGSGWRPVAGACEHGYELSSPIKDEELFITAQRISIAGEGQLHGLRYYMASSSACVYRL